MTYQISTEISESIFRAYDIRGIVPTTLNDDVAYTLGLAIGSEIKMSQQTQVVIGRDGRLSSSSLFEALTAGLLATACDVIDIGLVPTPVLYFATHHLKNYTGVMLTASHNPADHNGMKIVIAGETLSESRIQKLFHRVKSQHFVGGFGKLSYQSILAEYIACIGADVKINRPLRIVIDCGNGAAAIVAPELFRALGCEVINLHCEIDGNFPHHAPDPSVIDNLNDLIIAVRDHQADVGLAFDGDGDRLGVITPQGRVIYPDQQLILFAKNILAKYPGATIAYDVKCTRHLTDAIKQYGGKPIMTRTGHSFVKTIMQKEQALLAGELSGHIFWADRWFGFDDALYTAARLLEIVSQTEETFDEIFECFPPSFITPEIKLYVDQHRKFQLMQQIEKQAKFSGTTITIDGLRIEYADGWGLIRASNTIPALVLRFEADNVDALYRIQEEFRHQILAVDNSLELPF